MMEEILLINESIFGLQTSLIRKSFINNDIDSGGAYKRGMIGYLSDNSNDILLPIIVLLTKLIQILMFKLVVFRP